MSQCDRGEGGVLQPVAYGYSLGGSGDGEMVPVFKGAEVCPLDLLGPLGLTLAQHSPTTRPSVERTAEKALMLLWTEHS